MSKEDADQETPVNDDSTFIEPETGYGSPPKYDQGTGYPHLAYWNAPWNT